MCRQLAKRAANVTDLTRLSADWVWETDPDHRLSYLSESADIAFGGAWIRDLLGHSVWDSPTVDLPRVDWDAHRRVLSAHQVFERLQFALIDPSGELHHVQVSGGPVFDDAGHFAGYRGVGRNVTREYQQQLLLQIEGDIAAVIRDRSSTEEAIAATLRVVCELMNWTGGGHLVQIPGLRAIGLRERIRPPDLLQLLSQLPAQMPLIPACLEGRGVALPFVPNYSAAQFSS